jgi:hypothetical protein
MNFLATRRSCFQERHNYHLNDFGDVRIAPIGKLFEKAAMAKHPCLIERLSSANLSQPGVVAVGEGPILRIGENDKSPT